MTIPEMKRIDETTARDAIKRTGLPPEQPIKPERVKLPPQISREVFIGWLELFALWLSGYMKKKGVEQFSPVNYVKWWMIVLVLVVGIPVLLLSIKYIF